MVNLPSALTDVDGTLDHEIGHFLMKTSDFYGNNTKSKCEPKMSIKMPFDFAIAEFISSRPDLLNRQSLWWSLSDMGELKRMEMNCCRVATDSNRIGIPDLDFELNVVMVQNRLISVMVQNRLFLVEDTSADICFNVLSIYSEYRSVFERFV